MARFNRLLNGEQSVGGRSGESNRRSSLGNSTFSAGESSQSPFQYSQPATATNHGSYPLHGFGVNYPNGSYEVIQPFFGNLSPHDLPSIPINQHFLHHQSTATAIAPALAPAPGLAPQPAVNLALAPAPAPVNVNYNNIMTPINYPRPPVPQHWNNPYIYNNHHQILPSPQYSLGDPSYHHAHYFAPACDRHQAEGGHNTCPCVGGYGHSWGGAATGLAYASHHQAYSNYTSSPSNNYASNHRIPMNYNNFHAPSSSSASNDIQHPISAANAIQHVASNVVPPVTAPVPSQPPESHSEPPHPQDQDVDADHLEQDEDDEDDDDINDVYIGHISRNDNRSMQRPNNTRSTADMLSQLAREVQNAMDLLRNGGPMPPQGFLMVDETFTLTFEHLQVRTLRFPSLSNNRENAVAHSDNISFELLSEIERIIGNVRIGLEEEQIMSHIGSEIFQSINEGTQQNERCCICQEDYVTGEELGRLDCRHKYHLGCIKQWLVLRNTCPICKRKALAVENNTNLTRGNV